MWFAVAQSPDETSQFGDGTFGPSADALLALSPVLAGAVAILVACWAAFRAAASAQSKQAELASDGEQAAERRAGVMAWSDIESIFSFGGLGFVFTAVMWTVSQDTTKGIISLVCALLGVLVVLVMYRRLVKHHLGT